MIEDGVVLMYVKDGELYPVAMTRSERNMLQLLAKTFEPLQVVNSPQGKAVNLLDKGDSVQ